MRKIGIIAVLSLMAVALAAVPALAQNEHFVRASGTLNGNGSLTVNFKEAGLGTNQNIDYTLTADATATYVCVNRGCSITDAATTAIYTLSLHDARCISKHHSARSAD